MEVNKKQLAFPKSERLAWKRHIDTLFLEGQSFIAYPLRVVFRAINANETTAVLVSVPKKKIKRAVGRNFVKRRIKESYRLQKTEFIRSLEIKNISLHIAFLYLDSELQSYAAISKSMAKALRILQEKNE